MLRSERHHRSFLHCRRLFRRHIVGSKGAKSLSLKQRHRNLEVPDRGLHFSVRDRVGDSSDRSAGLEIKLFAVGRNASGDRCFHDAPRVHAEQELTGLPEK